MTNRELPCPKLRVTFRSSIPFFAHDAQTGLDKVDGDDEESANLIELDDCFCRLALDNAAADNELDFPRLVVALAFDDLSREDDGFKVKDRKVVIVKFLCGM